MTRLTGFRAAAWIALAAWVLTAAAVVAVAATGVAGLTGWSDDVRSEVHLVPGTDLFTMDIHPSWGVVGGGDICPEVRITDYPNDCFGLVLSNTEQRLDGDVVQQGPVRPVDVTMSGTVRLDTDPGWNPLIASIYLMMTIGLAVIAYVLFQLWSLLHAAGRGEPFTDHVVRRLRRMGVVLVAWELVEPLMWLFLSPKAFDYSESYYGPVPSISLSSMEPGGPQLTVIAFGILLVLLASVFRHGAELHDEQKLTV